MKASALALAAAVALLGPWGCAHRPRDFGAAPWVEVRSPHFTLLADASEQEARALSLQLERIHAALLAGSWHAEGLPWRSPRVIVLADEASMRAYFPKGYQGFATSDPFGAPLLITHAEQSPSELPVLKHELAHAVDNGFLLRQPRWLSEGLAEYLETLAIEGDGAAAIFGALKPDRLAALQTMAAFDFAGVMRTGSELWGKPQREVEDFYAQAWLLVRVLIDGHREQFEDLLQRLARSEEPAAAFEASFPGVETQALETEALRWLRARKTGRLRVPLPPVRAAVRVRQVSPEETQTIGAELDWFASVLSRESAEKRQRALESAARALLSSPGNPVATALLEALQPSSAAARAQAARTAVAAAPTDARAWTLLGNALVQDGALTDEYVEARRNAVAYGADSAFAHAELALVLVRQGKAAEAVRLASRGTQLDPGNAGVLDVLATALAAAGRCAEAVKAGRRALELLPDSAAKVLGAALQQHLARVEQDCAPPRPEDPKAAAGSPAPTSSLSARGAGEANARPLPEGASPPRVAARAQPTRTCKTAGPRLVGVQAPREGLVVGVTFTIGTNGRISDVRATAKARPELVAAITAYLQGCTYAVTPGVQLPAEATESFSFTAAPGSRR